MANFSVYRLTCAIYEYEILKQQTTNNKQQTTSYKILNEYL
jgi:hypothetical protein